MSASYRDRKVVARFPLELIEIRRATQLTGLQAAVSSQRRVPIVRQSTATRTLLGPDEERALVQVRRAAAEKAAVIAPQLRGGLGQTHLQAILEIFVSDSECARTLVTDALHGEGFPERKLLEASCVR